MFLSEPAMKGLNRMSQRPAAIKAIYWPQSAKRSLHVSKCGLLPGFNWAGRYTHQQSTSNVGQSGQFASHSRFQISRPYKKVNTSKTNICSSRDVCKWLFYNGTNTNKCFYSVEIHINITTCTVKCYPHFGSRDWDYNPQSWSGLNPVRTF